MAVAALVALAESAPLAELSALVALSEGSVALDKLPALEADAGDAQPMAADPKASPKLATAAVFKKFLLSISHRPSCRFGLI